MAGSRLLGLTNLMKADSQQSAQRRHNAGRSGRLSKQVYGDEHLDCEHHSNWNL